MTNLAMVLHEVVQSNPDRVALRFDDQIIDYRLLDSLTARVSGLLASEGVGPGDRVAIAMPNTPHFPLAYYGILRLGAVAVPLSPLLSKNELTHILRDCGATALISWSDFQQTAAAAAEGAGIKMHYTASPRGAHDTGLPDLLSSLLHAPVRDDIASASSSTLAVVLYTSGTTGEPKGAALTHENLRRNAQLFGEAVGYLPSDVVLSSLPFFHSFGQTCLLNAGIRFGLELVLQPRFNAAEALARMATHRVTVFVGVPSMHAALLAEQRTHPRDLAALRFLGSGGAGLPPGLLNDLEAEFGVPVYEGYGLSETSPVTHATRPGLRRPGAVGQPLPGIKQRVVADDGTVLGANEVGELQVRGHAVMAGYFNRPEATQSVISPDGWFSTGDMATIDPAGFVRIVDRKKDVIIRNGFNIYPADVEAALSAHPAVQLAAVVGVPSSTVGEEVVALVVLKPGKRATESELTAFAREHVAAYKYPRVVCITDSLPLGPTGKVLKRAIDRSRITWSWE